MLARAAGELGHVRLFDTAITAYRHQLESSHPTGMFANWFTYREILVRGLVGTGRATRAARHLNQAPTCVPAAPQWTVIEHVTTGEVLLAVGDRDGAEEAFLTGIAAAETYRLPHQIQRAQRLASSQLDQVTGSAQSALRRLDEQLSQPRP